MGSKDVRRAGIALLTGACCVVPARPASAQEPLPVHITYDAPATCPSEKDFVELVAQAEGRLVQASEAQAMQSFVLRVSGNSPVTGRLLVRERDGSEVVRELNDPQCDAVVRAAAVVVALSAGAPAAMPSNPDSPEAPPPAPESPEPSPPAESLAPLPVVPGIAAGIPADPLHDDADVSPDESPVKSPSTHHAWRFDVSGEGVIGTGAKPSMTPGFAAYLELLEETPELFAPSIRVGFQADMNQGSADIGAVRRTVGRIDACPFRAVAAQPWSTDAFTIQACARVDIGKMDVTSWALDTQYDVQQLWLATAGLVRLRWMSKSIFLELEGGAVVPLVRASFAFGGPEYPSDPRDFEVPPIAGTMGLGFGVFFL